MTAEQRIDNLIEVLIEVAKGNYNTKPFVSDQNDIMDALAMGIELMIENISASEQTKRKYLISIEKTNKELDQFAYIISHDLKSPLRAITNLSQWIEDDLGKDVSEDIKKNMTLLRSRVHRMETLIVGVLEYSKSTRNNERNETVDVKKLLVDLIDLIAPPASFQIEIKENMPTIDTEKIKLEQVFSNLISNAIKYHDNPLQGSITIDCKKSDGMYIFSVQDNGPGIEPEYHEMVFKIFQTLSVNEKTDSNGIGLSIVKKIIEEKGGRVWIESEKGKGTRFVFTWPQNIVQS